MDGQKLRTISERRGLSQRELAEKVGTHQTSISKMERLGHEPAVALVSAIARVLCISAVDLAGNGSCCAALKPSVRRSASVSEHRRMPPARLAPHDPRVVRMLADLRRGRRPAPPVPRPHLLPLPLLRRPHAHRGRRPPRRRLRPQSTLGTLR